MTLKEVINPHTGQRIRFGRRAMRVERAFPKFRSYLMASAPPPPDSTSYSGKALPVLHDVMLNDQYGDCGIAAAYHIVGLETGNAGDLYHATKAQIIVDYSAIGGFDPSNPDATDNGIVLQDALNYYQSHGFADGTKLLGSLAVDASNLTESKQGVWLAENAYLGIALPDAWINPFPAKDGDVWDAAGSPDPNNGHCIPIVDYNKDGPIVCTWGILVQMTWRAYQKYAVRSAGGEAYLMFTPDQIAKATGKAGNGFDVATLYADFDALGANIPVPKPPPGPAPTPSPVPSGGAVTLEQAQGFIAAGFATAPPLLSINNAIKRAKAGLAGGWPK